MASNMGGGFLAGYYDIMGPRIARQQGLEDELRKIQIQSIYKAVEEGLGNGRLDVNTAAKFLDDALKLYPKEVRKMVQDGHNGMLQMYSAKDKAGQPKGQAQGQAQPQTQAPTQPQGQAIQFPSPMPSSQSTPPPTIPGAESIPPRDPVQTLMQSMPPPPRLQTQPSPIPQPQEQPMAGESGASGYATGMADLMMRAYSPNLQGKLDEFKKVFPNATDEQAMSAVLGRNVTPAIVKPMKIDSMVGEDGYEYTTMMDPTTQQTWTIKSPAKVREPGGHRPVNSSATMSVEFAKQLRDSTGEPPMGMTGPIDLDTIPDPANAKLNSVLTKDGLKWIVNQQKQIITPALGNIRYATTEFGRMGLPEGSGVPLGEARVATSGFGGQIVYDPSTQSFGVMNMPRSTTPTTTGITGRPTGFSSGLSQPPSTIRQPQTPPNPPTTTQPQAPKSGAAPTPPKPGSKTTTPQFTPVPFMRPTDYRMIQSIAIPLREAGNQAFGTLDHPDFKGLSSYAHLADDPKASRAIATAVQAIIKRVDLKEVNHGDIINLLRLEAGTPGAIIKGEVEAMWKLIAEPLKDHPEWQNAFNSTMATYATMMGMRAATRQPGTMFTALSLEREVPIPGLFTGGSRQFYDQMSKIALEIETVMGVLPRAVVPDRDRQFYHDRTAEMIRLANTGAPKPSLEELFRKK